MTNILFYYIKMRAPQLHRDFVYLMAEFKKHKTT